MEVLLSSSTPRVNFHTKYLLKATANLLLRNEECHQMLEVILPTCRNSILNHKTPTQTRFALNTRHLKVLRTTRAWMTNLWVMLTWTHLSRAMSPLTLMIPLRIKDFPQLMLHWTKHRPITQCPQLREMYLAPSYLVRSILKFRGSMWHHKLIRSSSNLIISSDLKPFLTKRVVHISNRGLETLKGIWVSNR